MKSVLNNKGYMLVEIIVASAIALTMAFFLMEMTLKIVNSNNDYYEESVLLFDKNIVTKEIMDDINKYKLISIDEDETSSENIKKYYLTFDNNEEPKMLLIDSVNKTISYGNYEKKFGDKLNIGETEIELQNDTLIIDIPAYTNYSKEDYGIKIVVPYSDVKVTYPTLNLCYDVLDNSGFEELKSEVRDKSSKGFDTITQDGEHGIYGSEDDLGMSCYFRGDVEYNYVKFGKNASNKDMYWRIIRINGDGTVRMIYDGTSIHANGVASTDRRIGTTVFNTSSDDNAYVGYMYGTVDSNTFEATHENKNNSAMKTYLENWYKTNILDSDFEDYIADAIYCSDRNIYDGTGKKNNITHYASWKRNINKTQSTPELTCNRKEDRFTVDNSLGNGMNKYPIGLLTWDEVIFAGALQGKENENKTFYLLSGNYYFIMTPSGFFENEGEEGIPTGTNKAFVAFLNSNGRILSGGGVDVERSVRPVISLKKGALQYGTGTSSDPFRVE